MSKEYQLRRKKPDWRNEELSRPCLMKWSRQSTTQSSIEYSITRRLFLRRKLRWYLSKRKSKDTNTYLSKSKQN